MSTLADQIAALPQGTYTPAFIQAMQFTMPAEVVFQKDHYDDYDFVETEHDSNDPGGTTRYGIDQRSNPSVEVENLDFAGAVAIYWKMWLALSCDAMPLPVSIVVFDADNNCGAGEAAKWLQEEINKILASMNPAPTPLVVDGSIGPKTIAACNLCDPATLSQCINDRRDYYYNYEVRASLRADYLKGWMNRLQALDALENLPSSTPTA